MNDLDRVAAELKAMQDDIYREKFFARLGRRRKSG
jgi:hypothetical protein